MNPDGTQSSTASPSQMHGMLQALTVGEANLGNDRIPESADIFTEDGVSHAMRLAEALLLNSAQAILITNAENKILKLNPAFTALTGYTLPEVLHKSPDFLKSHHHDAAFYQAMWESLHNQRFWQGQITNRKKCGALFTETLTIVAVHNAQAQLQYYLALFSDLSLQHAHPSHWQLANYDPLTRLPNATLFADRLEQIVKSAYRLGLGCAVVCVDVDHFKAINQSLSHRAGDDLLVQVSARMTGELRACDTVARLAGDRFGIILTDVQDEEAVSQVCEQVLEVLAQPFYLADQTIRISGSIGAAIYPSDEVDSSRLLQLAEHAMQFSKHQGGNCVSLYLDVKHLD